MAIITLPPWFDENAPQWAKDTVIYIGTIWNQGAYGLTYGEIFMAVVIVLIALSQSPHR